MFKRALVMLSILALPALGQAQSIIRDRSSHSRPVDLSILGAVPFPAGFGVGLRVGLPIVPNGFIGAINDAVFLEPGVQVVYWSDRWADFDDTRFGVQIPVFMRWDFFLSRVWTVYGEVGVLFGFFGDGHDRFKVKGGDIFRPGGEPG